jgi:hypothetical protein
LWLTISWFVDGNKITGGGTDEERMKLQKEIGEAAAGAVTRNITMRSHNLLSTVWVAAAMPGLKKKFGLKVVSNQEMVRLLIPPARAKAEGRDVKHILQEDENMQDISTEKKEALEEAGEAVIEAGQRIFGVTLEDRVGKGRNGNARSRGRGIPRGNKSGSRDKEGK